MTASEAINTLYVIESRVEKEVVNSHSRKFRPGETLERLLRDKQYQCAAEIVLQTRPDYERSVVIERSDNDMNETVTITATPLRDKSYRVEPNGHLYGHLTDVVGDSALILMERLAHECNCDWTEILKDAIYGYLNAQANDGPEMMFGPNCVKED